jgi:hypothetical protein
MDEGSTLLCTDNKHHVTIKKIISNQSFIVESTDKQLSFIRLVDKNNLMEGLAFASWINIFYRK